MLPRLSLCLVLVFLAGVLIPVGVHADLEKPLVDKRLGYKIALPKRWESQPLPPPTDYDAMGVSREEAEMYEQKTVEPLLINKGPQGCEFRLFRLDAADINSAVTVASDYMKTRRFDSIGEGKDVKLACRKTTMKLFELSKSAYGRTWVYPTFVASSENGSFLLLYAYLSTYRQYAKQIQESAVSFAWVKKEEGAPDESTDSRLDTPEGWDVLETQNYLIQYNEPNPDKVKEFGRMIERLHAVQDQVLPRDPQLEKLRPNKQRPKFIVKYFKDSTGFQNYARDEGVYGAAAYYNPSRGEIAFYLTGWKKQTLGILFHECTHQYLQELVGGPRVRFHICFNEGLAEYFNGTVQDDSARIVPGTMLSGSYQTVKRAIRDGSLLNLEELMKMTQAQFYQIGRFAYDHGWAIVYFLLHSDNKRYNEVLPTYFRAIQEKAFPVLQALSEDGVDINSGGAGADPGSSWQVLSNAQNDALTKCFEGIDMDQFQKDFEAFYR